MAVPPHSFELFPPRGDEAALRLGRTIDRLAATGPTFFSVTFGAGGSTRDRSLTVLRYIREHTEVPAMAHLTSVGASRSEAEERVHAFLAAGIRAFLALRGDPPQDAPDDLGELGSTVDLVELILAAAHADPQPEAARVAVAAFPAGHPRSASRWEDVDALLAKQVAGAELAITQIFFRAEEYLEYVERARAAGVTIPILPGLAPITRARQLVRIGELNDQRPPAELLAAMQAAADPETAAAIGTDYAVALAVEVLRGGAPAAHYFTFNEHEAVLRVHERVLEELR